MQDEESTSGEQQDLEDYETDTEAETEPDIGDRDTAADSSDNISGTDLPEIKKYVCDVCFVGNLTHSVNVKRCMQCQQIHCMHFTSKIDPQYCVHCMHDVQLDINNISKTQIIYDENNDKIEVKTRKAKQIRFTGLHWLFNCRKIDEYSDIELELAIEYHRATFNALLMEREQRRIQHIQRKYKVDPSLSSIIGISPTETSATEVTTVRKSRTIKSTKTTNTAAAFQAGLDQLKASGLSIDKIMELLKGKK